MAPAITLVTNYKFHLEKMNEDSARELVESVIGRLVNQPVSVSTEIRGANGSTSLAPAPSPVTYQAPMSSERPTAVLEPPAQESADRSEVEKTLIDAAKKLFDAEEIKPTE